MRISRIFIQALAVGVFIAGAGGGCASGAGDTGALDPETVRETIRRAADYGLTVAADDAVTSPTEMERESSAALFHAGLLAAYGVTSEPKYLHSVLAWGHERRWRPGARDARRPDLQACGQVYLECHALKNDRKMLAGVQETVDRQMASPRPGREEWWWCESLAMAPPVLVRLYAASGSRAYLQFLDTMFWDACEPLYDKEEHLFFRDKDSRQRASIPGGRKVFWSRGNGFVLAGLARILQYLPADEPSRPAYEKLFKEMAEKAASAQQEDGMWRPSLLDPDEVPTGESGGSALFTYALAWGVNNGLLDGKKFSPVVRKGWAALAGKLDEAGRLGYVQETGPGPAPVDPEGSDRGAAGAFLLAGGEVLMLLTLED